MELFYTLAILIIIATAFYYINLRYLKLQPTIGIMAVAIVFSILLVIAGKINERPLHDISQLVNRINFTQLVMGGMLYFLLFAGAIQININDLKKQKLPIIVFSSLSVIISTFVVGFALYYTLLFLSSFLGNDIQISLIYCLLFGALISPTDPVAVLSILKNAKVSKALETEITGESLLNDGVAVIMFSVFYSIAEGTQQVGDIKFLSISWLLVKEVFGALLIGIILGYMGFYAMRRTNDYKFWVLVTLSVVILGYIISKAMEISGPLTMVASGILIGNACRKYSKEKHIESNFVNTFWELTDDILNAVLFLLIGFELLLIPNLGDYWISGLICILIVLFARYVSIRIPVLTIPFKEKFSRGAIVILVWGGLRGGVSIALALSIGDIGHRNILVAITYFVVVFSIIVQGLTIGKVARKLSEKQQI